MTRVEFYVGQSRQLTEGRYIERTQEREIDAANMTPLVISEYRLVALHGSPQAYGTTLRPCSVQQREPNSPIVARLYRYPEPQGSFCKLSVHETLGAVGLSGQRRFTDWKNPTRVSGRFGNLSRDISPPSNGVSSTFKQGHGIRAGVGIGPADKNSFKGESTDAGQPSVRALTAPSSKGLLRVADKVGHHLLNMITNTNKKLQDYMNNVTSSTTEEKEGEPENVAATDWERWQKVFVEVEEREKLTSTLSFQLEGAIMKEQFREAAVLKEAIAHLSAKDAVSELMKEMKHALIEERHYDAASLHKGGAGLLGWWIGTAESEGTASYGHIIHISAAHGRFIAKSFNASQLTAGEGPGAPLFEVFVTKTGKQNYSLQAFYLKHEGNISSDTDTTDLINVDAPERLQPNTPPDIGLKQAETNDDHDGSGRGIDKVLQDPTIDNTVRGESNNMEKQESNESSVKLLITGAIQNSIDDKDIMAPMRIPAQLERKTKDSFTFSFREVYRPGSWRSTIAQSEAISGGPVLNVEKGSIADKLSSVTVISKVAKEMGEIARLAVTQARRSQRLAEITSFRRINTLETDSDPFSSLYVGDFGFCKSHLEVVQLRRKFGNWGGDKLEFFQYVEAVKLTGDLDFPAGEVMFRAKIGEGRRLSSSGSYPEDLGVTGRFKGQVRLVEPGSQIRHSEWIDGELVLLDPKRGSRTKGSELGFAYSVHERLFLALFNRLKLQD
ncbi:hypothetical protein R1sor_017332 [Riccia sorocarpa]|uniref:Uncharacterized protein n=1 Tax=Riccia sorocarpa TaxID=122646 RepID=A0ABD3IA59_9MARC